MKLFRLSLGEKEEEGRTLRARGQYLQNEPHANSEDSKCVKTIKMREEKNKKLS